MRLAFRNRQLGLIGGILQAISIAGKGDVAIVILGHDEHAMRVLEHLEQRGADAVIADSRSFPTGLRLSFWPERRMWRLRLPGGRTLHSGEITAVYWRTYDGVRTPELPNWEQSDLAANDARSLFESLLVHLPARWVNGFAAFQLHQMKPVMLARVAAMGVAIPITVISNEPGAVTEFAANGETIFKPVQGGSHARRLTQKQLEPENLRNLDVAPVTVQQFVPGTNVRAFVAGDRVLSCEVRTDAIDFRDDPHPKITAHAMPETIQSQCRAIARELHLLWTGIDFRLTPDGRYVFLEANPSPMFYGFELATGLPLTEALGDLLVADSPAPSTIDSHGSKSQ